MTDLTIWRGVRRLGIYVDYRGIRILVIIDEKQGTVEARRVSSKKQALEKFNDVIYEVEYPCIVAEILRKDGTRSEDVW